MKKFLSVFLCILIMSGCGAKAESFKGKEYKLRNAENNAEIILGFGADGNRFFGKVVNNYFGTYAVEKDNISFGPAGATMMMGPEALMDAESNYLQMLPAITSFSLDGKKLVLKTADGKELVFEEIGNVKK